MSKSKSKNVTKKKFVHSKISKIENLLEVENNYGFRVIIKPNGEKVISRSSQGNLWDNIKLDTDYKLLRAWRTDYKETDLQSKNKTDFNNKYSKIGFDNFDL